MTYFKLNPARRDLVSLFDVMDNVLGGKDMFELSRTHKTITPAVNVKETTEGYTLELIAPGIAKEDIKVEVDKNVLTISYTEQKQEQKDETSDKYLRKEFGYRSFKRSFTLPELANKEDITASYANGVLSLHIAKKEVEAPKTIEIA